MSLLEVKNLTYTYGQGTPFVTHAVNDVSFSVENGEIIGLIGHTGSGKSTIVQMLNGLIEPENGTILFDGRNIKTDFKKIKEVRFNIGLVFQYPEYQLFEETVEKDIAYGPTNMGLSSDEIAERVKYAAELVGLTDEMLKKSPFDLSGGEKRRVAIAGIIAMRPKVLILDEPTAGLDPKGRDMILSRIKEYRNETGAAVIIVSHSMEDMAKTADKLLVMNRGNIEMFDKVSNVFSNVERLVDIGLDVPHVTKIAIELNKRGFDIPKNIFTVSDLKEAIISCKKGGNL
ncbi:MAG: energy-coupling factor transporter ATPase [Clostridia bacterium]|nr:energy-coupling factor transporter ATPase [Clostridia bacterium]